MSYDRYVRIWLQYWLVIRALSLQNIFIGYSGIFTPTLHNLNSQLKCLFCIYSCISPRRVVENKKRTFEPTGAERIGLIISSGYLRPTNFALFTKYYNGRPNAEQWVCADGSMTNTRDYFMFIGPCIIVIVEEWKTSLMSLANLFHFLCAQHVSDINISIIRSLRLCC